MPDVKKKKDDGADKLIEEETAEIGNVNQVSVKIRFSFLRETFNSIRATQPPIIVSFRQIKASVVFSYVKSLGVVAAVVTILGYVLHNVATVYSNIWLSGECFFQLLLLS